MELRLLPEWRSLLVTPCSLVCGCLPLFRHKIFHPSSVLTQVPLLHHTARSSPWPLLTTSASPHQLYTTAQYCALWQDTNTRHDTVSETRANNALGSHVTSSLLFAAVCVTVNSILLSTVTVTTEYAQESARSTVRDELLWTPGG
jgi:hypothetical protein